MPFMAPQPPASTSQGFASEPSMCRMALSIESTPSAYAIARLSAAAGTRCKNLVYRSVLDRTAHREHVMLSSTSTPKHL